jgi:hypothetical protein
MTPQNKRGLKNSKKIIIEQAHSQSPKKFFACCSVAIRVQK